MSHNVAIIIGVSNYDNHDALPACTKDIELMSAIVTTSGRFETDNILIIRDDTTATNVKSRLATFIEGQHNLVSSGTSVNELFFYFTGHGLYDSEEFYFILSDYHQARRHATALANSDLDTWLKSLSPALTVKVVDACNSGVYYVKEPDDDTLAKHIRSTRAGYNKCYFMFSSQRDEKSHATTISHFTNAFGEAIYKHAPNTIRYRDITEHIADSFDKYPEPQRPVFIDQSLLTEHFEITDSMRSALDVWYNPDHNPAPPEAEGTTTPPVKSPSLLLLEKVRLESEHYCTEEEAKVAFDAVFDTAMAFCLPESLASLYTIEVETFTTIEQPAIPGLRTLTSSLVEAKTDMFVSFVYEDEEYETREPVNSMAYYNMIVNPLATREYRTVKKMRRVATRFAPHTPVELKAAKLRLRPSQPSLPTWIICVIPLSSRVEMSLYTMCGRFVSKDWDTLTCPDKIKWQAMTTAMKPVDRVRVGLLATLLRYCALITEGLYAHYGISDGVSADATSEEPPKS